MPPGWVTEVGRSRPGDRVRAIEFVRSRPGRATAPAATPARPALIRAGPWFARDRRDPSALGFGQSQLGEGAFSVGRDGACLTGRIEGDDPMENRRTCLAGLAALPFSALAARVGAQAAEIHAPDRIAVGGMDVVSYFAPQGPVRGQAAHALVWRGAEWRFASAVAREAFEMEPVAYAPCFGGYCAWSMSQGVLASGDPLAWSVFEGRLYLTHDAAALQRWMADPAALRAMADAHWPQVLWG